MPYFFYSFAVTCRKNVLWFFFLVFFTKQFSPCRSLMRKNAAREQPLIDVESEVIKLIKEPSVEMPRLIQTVLQVR